jgi:hypothetical protein
MIGATKNSATITTSPSNWKTGDIAPTALPPSSGSSGARLNRLMMKLKYASPKNNGSRVAA